MEMQERNDYPRPDFKREVWQNLNGIWEFAFDDSNEGEALGYQTGTKKLPLTICVPYAYQSKASGINDSEIHNVVWYQLKFDLSAEGIGKEPILNFGAVDYVADIWLNGIFLGRHIGGYTPFHYHIAEIVNTKSNILVVRAIDSQDTAQPRGKQYWKEQTDRCWYISSSGIWQSVWIEYTGKNTFEQIKMTPDIDDNSIKIEFAVNHFALGDYAITNIFYNKKKVKSSSLSLDGIRNTAVFCIQVEDYIDECHYWTPEKPNLYQITFELVHDGNTIDTVESYFGMRKITIDQGRIMLNYKPYYLKTILDQGYWADSLLTPPSDEAIRKDVEMTKELGFNCARKHQKIEDPRYYYWADKLGLLVWGEVPSAYEFCDEEINNVIRDFQEFIKRDYNHPCIIVWVPLNESWGVRKILTDKKQQHFGEALYHLAKAMDETRLVCTNDGWENVKTDIVGIHDYTPLGSEFNSKYNKSMLQNPEGFYSQNRRLYAFDQKYARDSVFMITEYGGIAMQKSINNQVSWGYFGIEKDEPSFLNRYADITQTIMNLEGIAGFCYTQLTDVFQEVNGLLDSAHQNKVDKEMIRRINNGEKIDGEF